MAIISYDVTKLTSLYDEYATAKGSIVSDMNTIKSNLLELSLANNWSGPVANSAKNDLSNAFQAIEDIKKNMNVIERVLADAKDNFGKIQY